MRYIEYESWFDEYEPIMEDNGETIKDFHPNIVNKEERLQSQEAVEKNKIWTLIDSENGLVITNGLHWINRLDVYITKQPYNKDEIIEVKY